MAAPSPAKIVARLSVAENAGTRRIRAGPSLTSTFTSAPQSGHLTSSISLRLITAVYLASGFGVAFVRSCFPRGRAFRRWFALGWPPRATEDDAGSGSGYDGRRVFSRRTRRRQGR